MVLVEPRVQSDYGARRMTGVLDLVVVGGAVVLIDVNVGPVPLLPDAVGYVLVAVGGARLAGMPAEGPTSRRQLRAAGVTLCAVAAISAVSWLAATAGWRPVGSNAAGAVAWFDAILLAALVAAVVALLVTVSHWFAANRFAQAASRLGRAAHAFGWPWGAYALVSLLATVVGGSPHVLSTVLVVPVVVGLLASLAYTGWVLHGVRRELGSTTIGDSAEANVHHDGPLPSAWTIRRQAQVAAVVVLALVVVGIITLSGVAGPRVSLERSGVFSNLDANDPQHLVARTHVPLRNGGWLPVTIESFEPPDIDGVTWERINGLPTTLQAGATQEIVIAFAVAGCDVDLGAYDVMPVRAASGLAPSRVVRVPAPGWLLDAVSSACGTPTDGIGP